MLAPWRRCRRARARLWNNHIRVAAFVRMNSFVKNAFRSGCPLTCLSKKMFQELRQFVLFKQALNQCAPFGAGGCGDSRSIYVCCMHRERTIGTGGFVYLLFGTIRPHVNWTLCLARAHHLPFITDLALSAVLATARTGTHVTSARTSLLTPLLLTPQADEVAFVK